ncbi:hypothetical protein Acr_10g0010580 [Actinidia rufa]|uniref:Uncharacterized protein n=1 Tax=Actinidia rufa TaxID=165716 RepID=A0A7J0FAM6_9ERIC|nr:hypothetical protein Acr_10g0010580 [Actinidia rufa]
MHPLEISPELQFDLHAGGILSDLASSFTFVRLCRSPEYSPRSNFDCRLLAPNFYHNSLAPSVGTTVLNLLCTCAAVIFPNQVSAALQMRVMNENNARLIQRLAAANPPPLAAPPIPDVKQSRHSSRPRGRSQNHSTDRVWRGIRRSPSPLQCERSSSLSESSEIPAVEGEEAKRGRSPRRGDQIGTRDKSTSQKIRDLDARLDAINIGAGAPVIVDTLIRQTEPPFTQRILKARKETESLKDYVKQFNQTVLEVEDPSDKVVIMAMIEGLRPGPLFDSLYKNVPETLFALQSKADKYIAAEELVEAKRRRQGKDDHKRKELETRRIDYREETRSKRSDQDPTSSPRVDPTSPQCSRRPGALRNQTRRICQMA